MNELMKIETDESGDQLVSGRELHKFLGVETRYDTWFERISEYGFIENIDFILVGQKRPTNNPKNPETSYTDHMMKMDMAKEISMITKNEKGKQARRYFIAVEKTWKNKDIALMEGMKQEIIKLHEESEQIAERLRENAKGVYKASERMEKQCKGVEVEVDRQYQELVKKIEEALQEKATNKILKEWGELIDETVQQKVLMEVVKVVEDRFRIKENKFDNAVLATEMRKEELWEEIDLMNESIKRIEGKADEALKKLSKLESVFKK